MVPSWPKLNECVGSPVHGLNLEVLLSTAAQTLTCNTRSAVGRGISCRAHLLMKLIPVEHTMSVCQVCGVRYEGTGMRGQV